MSRFAPLTALLLLGYGAKAQSLAASTNSNALTHYVEPAEFQKGDTLPPTLYIRAQRTMSTSKAFKNFNLEETKLWIDTAYNWDAPKELQNAFPYYFSGYDNEDRPIWIAEVGKYNVRKVVEEGPGAVEQLEKYLFQGIVRMIKTMHAKDTPEREIESVFLIGDWEGLDMSQVTHMPTVAFFLRMLLTYMDFLLKGVGKGIGFNMNFAAEAALKLATPFLGNILSRIELYGTNQEKWMAALQRALPPETIPSWYGGPKDYKPLEVYG